MRRPLAVVVVAGLAVTVGATALVKHMDQDNRFCIACHLHQPHFRGMVRSPATTLAGAHHAAKGAGHPERCFTCHSGEGVAGWSAVTLLSAYDAARWVLGDRHEPVSMRLPIENSACLKCHARDVRGSKSDEETDRYHELANHRAVRTPCVSCHLIHRTGEPARDFLDDATVRAQCRACHRDFGEGGM